MKQLLCGLLFAAAIVAGVLALGTGGGVWLLSAMPPDRLPTESHEVELESTPAVLTPLESLAESWDSAGPINWQAANTLAMISDLAYKDDIESIDPFKALGFTERKATISESMYGYVVSTPDVAVVVFRGTELLSFADWVINFHMTESSTSWGIVHAGFHRAYHGMREDILQELARVKPAKIWVTGHSLGGALAQLCALDLKTSGIYSLAGLVTFGQPSVGRQGFAELTDQLLANSFTRFVNDADPVPRVPPGFHSAGSLIWFTGGRVETRRRRSTIKRASLRRGPSDEEPKPMTPAEFEEFREEMERVKARASAPPGDPNHPVYETVIRPWQDHYIAVYLSEIGQRQR